MMGKMNKKRTILAAFLSAFMLISCWMIGGWPTEAAGGGAGKLEVHFIDIGQGDATLIKTDGHAMLIDAGNNSKGTAVQNYLKKQGVKKLDYVIGTHPDADHIGGLDVIIYKFDCGKVLLPGYKKETKTYADVEASLKAKGYKALNPSVGEEFQLGKAAFTVIAPAERKFDSANDYSVAIRLEHGKNHFLLIGDAEEDSEQEMLKSGQKLDANVYKVSHHGSKTGTSEELLGAVNPTYAVISCGEDNAYGHPHAEVMNLLRKEGVKVFRTDEQGTIVAVSDGEKIIWNMSPDESWKAGEPKGTDADTESAGDSAKGDSLEKNAGSAAKVKGSSEYILNTNTKKIHNPSCSSVDKMAGKNRKKTRESLKDLERKGYEPCKNCLGE